MNKKYQIFISSTYEDLKEERRKVQDTILAMHQFPIGMEMFSAANDEQWKIIQDTIDSSDYYILIIGHRYGSVIQEGEYEGISYTQKEFRYALAKGIPILAFLIEKSVPVTPDKMEKDFIKKEKLNNFKEEVLNGRTVQWWTSMEDLAVKVSIALTKEMNYQNRLGWIRPQGFNRKFVSNELIPITEIGIEQISLKELLGYAKKEIYIFGNTLASLHDEIYLLEDILKSGIQVNLLAMDISDKRCFERNCMYFGAGVTRMEANSLSAMERLSDCIKKYPSKLKVRVSSFPMVIGIVAMDIEEDNGIIIATHLIWGTPTKECLIAKICKDSDLYEKYKKHLLRFWEEYKEVNQVYYNHIMKKDKAKTEVDSKAKVFLSYCHKDEEVADKIYDYFKSKKEIELHRDKIDVKVWKSFKQYMQSLTQMDYVILLISNSYLQSSNCLYEVLEVMRDRNYSDKIFPAVISKEIYDTITKINYVKYWQDRYNELKEIINEIEPQNIGKLGEDLKRTQNISSNIANFLDTVSDMNNPAIDDVCEAIENKLKGVI